MKDFFEEAFEPRKQQILAESGQEWIDNFVAGRYKQKPQKIKRQKRYIHIRKIPFIAELGSAAVLVLVLSLYFTWGLLFPPPPDCPPAREFHIFNRRFEVYSLTNTNTYLGQRLTLSFDDDYELTIRRFYDNHYMQNLYFEMRFECCDSTIRGDASIYTNRYFTPRERDFGEITYEITDGEFSIFYRRIVDFDLIYTIDYLARLQHSNGIIIYIEFTQLSLDRYGTFFDFISKTFLIP